MFDDDDLDDLLGPPVGTSEEPEETKRGPGRPKGSKTKKPAPGTHMTVASLNEVMTGVPIPFLVQVFRMGRQAVQERLKPLNPIKHGNNGAPYYDLQRAAEHLVDPKIDLNTYLKSLGPEDMPEQLRDSYWSSKLKRQKWEQNAGDLWHTDDVQQVFGEMFRILKTRVQLVTDSVEKKNGLTAAQKETMKVILEAMLNAIREDIKDQVKAKKTRNQLGNEADV